MSAEPHMACVTANLGRSGTANESSLLLTSRSHCIREVTIRCQSQAREAADRVQLYVTTRPTSRETNEYSKKGISTSSSYARPRLPKHLLSDCTFGRTSSIVARDPQRSCFERTARGSSFFQGPKKGRKFFCSCSIAKKRKRKGKKVLRAVRGSQKLFTKHSHPRLNKVVRPALV
jgi:hypothetical protein